MLNLLRKDFCFNDDPQHPVDDVGREGVSDPPAVPATNQARNVATFDAAPHSSNDLDLDAIEVFCQPTVGTTGGHQNPSRERILQPAKPIEEMEYWPTEWFPRASPKLRLASAAPGVEQLVSGLLQSATPQPAEQALQQRDVIPMSPIEPCNRAQQTSTAAPSSSCKHDQLKPAPHLHAPLQSFSSWPSVIADTPESFPSCDPVAHTSGDTSLVDNTAAISNTDFFSGSGFQGFEPGSEKLAPALDFLIRAESMQGMGTPIKDDGQRAVTPGLKPSMPCNNHHSCTPPVVDISRHPTGDSRGENILQSVHAPQLAPSLFHLCTSAAQVLHQPSEQSIQGYHSSTPISSAATVPVFHQQVPAQVPCLPTRTSNEITPGVTPGIRQFSSFIPDTRSTPDVDESRSLPATVQHGVGQQSVTVNVVMNMSACQQTTARNGTPDDVTPASVAVASADGLNVQDPLQANANRAQFKRRRRRSRTPLDPAFAGASQEQLLDNIPSVSLPSTSCISLLPAQQMHSDQLNSLPSSLNGSAGQAVVPAQQHDVAQAITPHSFWDGSDVALQSTGRLIGQGLDGTTTAPNSGKHSSVGGSSLRRTPTTQHNSRADVDTPASIRCQSTESGSDGVDVYRTLKCYLQPVVVEVLKRKYDPNRLSFPCAIPLSNLGCQRQCVFLRLQWLCSRTGVCKL
jgi:hypothetical protein